MKKNITVSLTGTLNFLHYSLLAVLKGWRLRGVNIAKPIEWVVEMEPPTKARS